MKAQLITAGGRSTPAARSHLPAEAGLYSLYPPLYASCFLCLFPSQSILKDLLWLEARDHRFSTACSWWFEISCQRLPDTLIEAECVYFSLWDTRHLYYVFNGSEKWDVIKEGRRNKCISWKMPMDAIKVLLFFILYIRVAFLLSSMSFFN